MTNISRSTMKRLTKDALRQAIAKNLRQARLTINPQRSQSEVAGLFDPPLTRTAVAQWEIGETMPDIDRLAVLSKAYGVSIDSLVFGEEKLATEADRIVLTAEAEKLVKKFTQLDRDKRAAIIALVLAMP